MCYQIHFLYVYLTPVSTIPEPLDYLQIVYFYYRPYVAPQCLLGGPNLLILD